MTKTERVMELRNDPDRHYGCSESILMAFHEELGIGEEEAGQIGRMFGGGMHYGGPCGTISAALMLLGIRGGGKPDSIKLIHDFRERFGSPECRDLVRQAAEAGIPKKECCDAMIKAMAEMLETGKPL